MGGQTQSVTAESEIWNLSFEVPGPGGGGVRSCPAAPLASGAGRDGW